jgi:tRNA (guanine37-N1)-methyltransferase
MNLPESAVEFLDAFRGLFRSQGDTLGDMWEVESIYDRMPKIHCYCFTKGLEEEAARKEITKVRHLCTPIETDS